ncbi:unnamed protein product [Alopecurus aequalis]
MGNTHQAGIKKDDHGGICHQHPQAASVAPHQLPAGVKGVDHGVTGCSHDQQPLVVSVVDLDQFPAAAADRARNQLQPLGGEHGVETTSVSNNCKKDSATDGGGRSSRIDIIQPPAESVILRHDDDPPHPSLPVEEGVQFVLDNIRVKKECIGDGDGFTVYVKKVAAVAVSGSYKGIDAPEMNMEYGEEARNELVKLIGGKCVTINVYGTDQYGRYLGDIFCDGIFIQEEMLKRGFAWYFRTGESRPKMERWEKEAREARLGLWLSDNPQKPWEWKRDHPRNNRKESANGIQSPRNEGIENLPWLISKDMETLGREWKKKLENIVAENVELNNYLHELKRNKKEAEDRAKELEKEMERVVADNMKLKLNDQLEESKKNKKKADDRILKLTFFSESVVAVNMNLHDKLEKLKEKNKKAEDQAKESEKEMESVVAVNRELNGQLQELKGHKKVAEDRAAELQFSYDSAAAINMDLLNTLEELREKSRKAEDRAKEWKKEMGRVVADNMKLNGQVQRLNNMVSNNARNSKKKLQNVIAINMDLKGKLQELQKNNEKANKDGAEESDKETENVVAEEQRSLQGVIVQEKSEQAVEAPSAASPEKVLNSARKSKKKLLNVIAVNMDLKGKRQELQKNNEKAMDRAEESEKQPGNVVAEVQRNLQGVIMQEKSEQAVEAPSAAPLAKGFGEKETAVVWRKKTAATNVLGTSS